MAIDRGNPLDFLRSIQWKQAIEGSFHGQLDFVSAHQCTTKRCDPRHGKPVL